MERAQRRPLALAQRPEVIHRSGKRPPTHFPPALSLLTIPAAPQHRRRLDGPRPARPSATPYRRTSTGKLSHRLELPEPLRQRVDNRRERCGVSGWTSLPPGASQPQPRGWWRPSLRSGPWAMPQSPASVRPLRRRNRAGADSRYSRRRSTRAVGEDGVGPPPEPTAYAIAWEQPPTPMDGSSGNS